MRLDSQNSQDVQGIAKKGKINKTIHSFLLLDCSGSMRDYNKIGIAKTAIKEDMDNPVKGVKYTLVSFTGSHGYGKGSKCIKVEESVEELKAEGGTPLADAINQTLDLIEECKDDKIIFKIFTDGGETGSSVSNTDVAKRIKACQDKGYVITFIGTQEHVNECIKLFGIDATNTMVHLNTAASVKMSFNQDRSATATYATSVAEGTDTNVGFYTKEVV